MKKLLLMLFVAIGNNTSAQTTHRITAGMNLQTEITNAMDGDIFMVESGNYGNITITKQISLIGTGYILSQSASIGISALAKVKFNTGSAGSMLTGFKTDDIVVSVPNVLISRNYCGNVTIGLHENEGSWSANADNCIIKQNLSKRLMILSTVSPGHTVNFSCRNNIFFQGFQLEGVTNGEIINNTFDCDIIGDEQPYNQQSYISRASNYSSNGTCGKTDIIFKNNIMTNISNDWCPITSYPSDIFLNNVLCAGGPYYSIPTNLGTTNTIIITAQLSNLYIGYPTNASGLATDARNQLATNSPAKGSGENSTDCGAFGGDEPFVLNGIPFVPTIYDLKVPQTISQGGTLNVQIKAKTNN